MVSNNEAIRQLGVIETHLPGANKILAETVKKMLKEDMNIDADISLGFLGTGIGSSKNTYRDMTNGQYISHAEVINRIKKAY